MATLASNSVAALVALFHETGLGLRPPFGELDNTLNADYSKEQIVIVGGGSQTGKFAIQFARLAGIGKIIAVAGMENDATLRKLGATHVIDRHANDVIHQVRKIVEDDLRYAIDTINKGDGGHNLVTQVLSNTKKGIYASLGRGSPSTEVAKAKTGGFETRFILGSSHLYPDLSKPFWRLLPRWIQQGKLTPLEFTAIDGLDVSKINAVLDAHRDGQKVGKVHVHPRG